MSSERFQAKTGEGEAEYKFFKPGGILFRELELLDSDDMVFETARYVSKIPKDKLQKEIVPMIEGLEDNTFAIHDRQNFISLRGRDPDKKNAHFIDYVNKILQKWGSDLPPETRTSLPPEEIAEFTEGLGFREELVFRLYRIRQFSRKHSSSGISYWELKKDPRWEDILNGLGDGGVLAIVAMRSYQTSSTLNP